jgi:hypothetical protein
VWYLGALVISIISPGVGMPGRNDDVLLLLVIGPIGSAVLALLGGALGFVFAGLSWCLAAKSKAPVQAVEKLNLARTLDFAGDQAEGQFFLR